MGRTNKCEVAKPYDKPQDGGWHRVLESIKEPHVYKPREERIQRKLLGVDSHQSQSCKYPEA